LPADTTKQPLLITAIMQGNRCAVYSSGSPAAICLNALRSKQAYGLCLFPHFGAERQASHVNTNF